MVYTSFVRSLNGPSTRPQIGNKMFWTFMTSGPWTFELLNELYHDDVAVAETIIHTVGGSRNLKEGNNLVVSKSCDKQGPD